MAERDSARRWRLRRKWDALGGNALIEKLNERRHALIDKSFLESLSEAEVRELEIYDGLLDAHDKPFSDYVMAQFHARVEAVAALGQVCETSVGRKGGED